MTELPELAHPTLFLLSVPGGLLLVLFTLWFSNTSTVRRVLSGVLRAVLLVSLFFYLAEPRWTVTKTKPSAQTVLLDTSQSISTETWQKTYERTIRRIENRPSEAGPVHLFLFGGTYQRIGTFRDGSWDRSPNSNVRGRNGPPPELHSDLQPFASRILEAAGDLSSVSPSSRPARTLIFTDGYQNPAGISKQEPSYPGSFTGPLAFSPIPGGRPDPAALQTISAPPQVRVGEPFQLELLCQSRQRGQAQVVVRINQQVQKKTEIQLNGQGKQWKSLEPMNPFKKGSSERKKPVRITVRLILPDDPFTRNNVARTGTVLLPPIRILAVTPNDEPGPAVRALRAQGLDVRTLPPDRIDTAVAQLKNSDLVLLDEPAPEKNSGFEKEIRPFVQQNGGGLLVISGTGHSARSWMKSTPLRTLLPVRPVPPRPESQDETDPEKQPKPATDASDDSPGKTSDSETKPDSSNSGDTKQAKVSTVSLMLVIDKSGSMSGKKIGLVKEAAIAALDTLDSNDRIGVIAFDHNPRVVTDPIKASRKNLYKNRIARLYANGGTDAYSALQLAGQKLEREKAGLKHIILLSDGESPPADFKNLVTRLQKRNITISTVAAGKSAARKLLANIARWGNGDAYQTTDFKDIPQIFTSETRALVKASNKSSRTPKNEKTPDRPEEALPKMTRQKSDSTPEEQEPSSPKKNASSSGPKNIPVRIHEPVPLLHGFETDSLPPVRKILHTQNRSLSLLPLVAEPDKTFPFFAYEYAGAGNTGIFLTSFDKTSAPDWIQWDHFPRLLGQTVRALSSPRTGERLHPSFEVKKRPGEQMYQIRVTIPEEARNLLEVKEHRLRWRTSRKPDSWHDLSLSEQWTGTYGGTFKPSKPGSYVAFRLDTIMKNGRERTHYHFMPSTIPEEFRVHGTNSSFFRQMNQRGATVIRKKKSVDQALRTARQHSRKTSVPVPHWPLGLVALVIVIDVFLNVRLHRS